MEIQPTQVFEPEEEAIQEPAPVPPPSPSPAPRAPSKSLPRQEEKEKAPSEATMRIWRKELLVCETIGLTSTVTMLRCVLNKTYPGWQERPWETKKVDLRVELTNIDEIITQVFDAMDEEDMAEVGKELEEEEEMEETE